MDVLRTAFVNFFTDWLEMSDTGKGDLEHAVKTMNGLTAVSPITPQLPNLVEKWLPIALQEESADHCTPLMNALAASYRNLHWQTLPPSYMGSSFTKGYALTQIIGQPLHDGQPCLFSYDGIAAGFALLAPNSFYPPHQKPAAEFCGILSGLAEWQIYYNPPFYHPSGAHIFHPPEAEHAMHAHEEPLLTVWVWTGNLAKPTAIQQTGWL